MNLAISNHNMQVVAAIGKEVGPADLTQYMEYHCRQLLRDAFQPKGFCYAVRRPNHYPEGSLSIEYDRETASDKDGQSLIRTVVHSCGETEPGVCVLGCVCVVCVLGSY